MGPWEQTPLSARALVPGDLGDGRGVPGQEGAGTLGGGWRLRSPSPLKLLRMSRGAWGAAVTLSLKAQSWAHLRAKRVLKEPVCDVSQRAPALLQRRVGGPWAAGARPHLATLPLRGPSVSPGEIGVSAVAFSRVPCPGRTAGRLVQGPLLEVTSPRAPECSRLLCLPRAEPPSS